MKIHVLIYGRAGRLSEVTSTDLRMLQAAALKQGHEVVPVYSRDCQLVFEPKPKILINNKPEKIKVLLVRANFLGHDIDQHTAIIKQFQMAGVKVINKHFAVERAKNKIRTMQLLGKFGVPVPRTYILSSSDRIDEGVKFVGGFPVILKTVCGSHGSGVSIVESKRGLRSVVELIMRSEGPGQLILQEYVKEAKGKDTRVFIVGKRILAAMERIAKKRGEFRSNFHLGGQVRVAEMNKKEKEVAFAAVKAIGLDMAGVDILRTKNGPKVLEVNANPGLEGITQASGRDIAGEIIKFAVKKAKRTGFIDKFKSQE